MSNIKIILSSELLSFKTWSADFYIKIDDAARNKVIAMTDEEVDVFYNKTKNDPIFRRLKEKHASEIGRTQYIINGHVQNKRVMCAIYLSTWYANFAKTSTVTLSFTKDELDFLDEAIDTIIGHEMYGIEEWTYEKLLPSLVKSVKQKLKIVRNEL